MSDANSFFQIKVTEYNENLISQIASEFDDDLEKNVLNTDSYMGDNDLSNLCSRLKEYATSKVCN